MKKIESDYQNRSKLDEVKDALNAIGHPGNHGDRGQGGSAGKKGPHTSCNRGAEYVVDFLPKVKIEIIAPTTGLPQIIET